MREIKSEPIQKAHQTFHGAQSALVHSLAEA